MACCYWKRYIVLKICDAEANIQWLEILIRKPRQLPKAVLRLKFLEPGDVVVVGLCAAITFSERVTGIGCFWSLEVEGFREGEARLICEIKKPVPVDELFRCVSQADSVLTKSTWKGLLQYDCPVLYDIASLLQGHICKLIKQGVIRTSGGSGRSGFDIFDCRSKKTGSPTL